MDKLHNALRQIQDDARRLWLPGFAAILYLIISDYLFQTPCPAAILLHFPCPGCGMTRALQSLIALDFSKALHYHAMIFFWIPLAVYFCVFRYFFRRQPPLFLPVCVCLGVITLLYYLARLLSGSAFQLLP